MEQVSAAISEMSEANKDLLEKYRKEVALRRKYHEQLVELKGGQGKPFFTAGSPFWLDNFVPFGPQATSACCVA